MSTHFNVRQLSKKDSAVVPPYIPLEQVQCPYIEEIAEYEIQCMVFLTQNIHACRLGYYFRIAYSSKKCIQFTTQQLTYRINLQTYKFSEVYRDILSGQIPTPRITRDPTPLPGKLTKGSERSNHIHHFLSKNMEEQKLSLHDLHITVLFVPPSTSYS